MDCSGLSSLFNFDLLQIKVARGAAALLAPADSDRHCLNQGFILLGLTQEVLLAAQGLLEMVGKFKPPRSGSWGERTKRTDHPVARTPFSGHRLN
jgi:hypothetical protein